jgi:prepilin-type N-terminal cleavage/methylation domain-containing protein
VLTKLRSRLAADREAGFTLMEMVVAMVIATILGAAATTWFIGVSDASTHTVDSDLGTASARNVLQVWAALLRVAGSPTDPGTGTGRITNLSATSITFHAYQASGSCTGACSDFATETVTFAMSGSTCGTSSPSNCTLTDTVATSSTSTTSIDVTGGVSAGSCLFTAYDDTGANLGCTGLSSTQLADVTRIGLAFAITTDGHTRNFQTSATFTQRPDSTS